MNFKFLIVIIVAVFFSLSCKSKHSNTSDEDIISDSDNSADIDTIDDSDAVTDIDISEDLDITEPDETVDENDLDINDEDIVDIDVIDIDTTDEEIPDPDTVDEIATDMDFADDIIIPDEDFSDPDISTFDEDYMTDDEIIANCVDGMCDVPAGQYTMGCAAADLKCDSDETPRHSVILGSYQIMKNEVTVEQYQTCVNSGNCNNNNAGQLHYAVWSNTVNYQYCNLGSARGITHPMNCVSWYGAKAYCEWLGMSLPTEAQWEYAAKGNDDRIFPWGDTAATCEYAVMKESGQLGCGLSTTWVIGSKTAGNSPFGTSDMAGNLMEWVNDWYSSGYYSLSPEINPPGPSAGSYKILRGGSWYKSSIDLRVSSRYYLGRDSLYDSTGFRCVKKLN